MKKTNQQSLLNAVIALVFSFVVGIVLIIFGVVCSWLTNEGFVLMGIPAAVIAIAVVLLACTLIDFIVRQNEISIVIAILILALTLLYSIIYNGWQFILHILLVLWGTVWFL